MSTISVRRRLPLSVISIISAYMSHLQDTNMFFLFERNIYVLRKEDFLSLPVPNPNTKENPLADLDHGIYIISSTALKGIHTCTNWFDLPSNIETKGEAVLLYLHIMSSLTVVRRGRDRLLFRASHVRIVSAPSYIQYTSWLYAPHRDQSNCFMGGIRDNLNDREGQQTKTYISQLVDIFFT